MNRSCMYVLIGLVACDSSAVAPTHDAGSSVDHEAATSDKAREPITLDALQMRPLAGLTARESRVVCDAVAARSDLCMVHAFSSASADLCPSILDECRHQDPPPAIDCSLAGYAFGESCSTTVGDYLSCITAQTRAISCEAKNQERPWLPECLPVVRNCPALMNAYGGQGLFVEPCDSSTAPERVDTDDDIRGIDACRPRPARMVSLGDSIVQCMPTSDETGREYCADDLIAEHLREHYVPMLQFSRYAGRYRCHRPVSRLARPRDTRE